MPDTDRLNILSIQDSIEKILVYTKSYSSADELYQNQRDFDAVLMNFIVIGEMVSRLSERFIEENTQTDWFKIKGFRNIVAHNYFGIDAEEVWQIIKTHIPILQADVKNILKSL